MVVGFPGAGLMRGECIARPSWYGLFGTGFSQPSPATPRCGDLESNTRRRSSSSLRRDVAVPLMST
eukprot:2275585-Pyramimonas_sp.AAC.1